MHELPSNVIGIGNFAHGEKEVLDGHDYIHIVDISLFDINICLFYVISLERAAHEVGVK
ncbi:hypothetical protein [Cobetia sp. L2A1]|uniref:hypothetical protein n=1 Tax=Cobetia sp. L2A1 TaxID=2686360 RepID=UPI00131E6F7A|nr:hypothetical protein [Cobetia sp. L2A1]